MVTGGSFFSRGSKVRYSGRVERELADDFGLDHSVRSGGGQAPENGAAAANRRSRSQAYASRRSASEPLGDYDAGEEEDDEDLGDDDASVDRAAQHHASRRHQHRSHSHSADRTGRHQRLSRLHEDGSSVAVPYRNQRDALMSIVYRFVFVSFCLAFLSVSLVSLRFAW